LFFFFLKKNAKIKKRQTKSQSRKQIANTMRQSRKMAHNFRRALRVCMVKMAKNGKRTALTVFDESVCNFIKGPRWTDVATVLGTTGEKVDASELRLAGWLNGPMNKGRGVQFGAISTDGKSLFLPLPGGSKRDLQQMGTTKPADNSFLFDGFSVFEVSYPDGETIMVKGSFPWVVETQVTFTCSGGVAAVRAIDGTKWLYVAVTRSKVLEVWKVDEEEKRVPKMVLRFKKEEEEHEVVHVDIMEKGACIVAIDTHEILVREGEYLEGEQGMVIVPSMEEGQHAASTQFDPATKPVIGEFTIVMRVETGRGYNVAWKRYFMPPVTKMQASRDGRIMVVLSNCTARPGRIMCSKTGRLLYLIDAPNDVDDLHVSHTGSIAMVSYEGMARVWLAFEDKGLQWPRYSRAPTYIISFEDRNVWAARLLEPVSRDHLLLLTMAVPVDAANDEAATKGPGTVHLWNLSTWKDRTHKYMHANFRALVFLLMCARDRLLRMGKEGTTALPFLPMEVWLLIFGMLHETKVVVEGWEDV
jgi:hypothetical protein